MAQIGIFRTKDAAKAAGDQFQSWIDRGLVNPTNLREFAAASNYSAKAIEDVANAAKVAGSALPMFQSALNEATNARRQLDSLLVDTMNVNRGFFVEFGQNLRQGASAWDSFKKAGSDALGHIADKLMQMAADNLFANAFGGKSGGGLFGLLGGLFGGSGGITLGGPGGPTPFAAANGGTFGPGWGVVGERGPELIKVNRGSVTVVPNHVSRAALPGFAAGGTLDSASNVRRMAFGQDNSPVVMNDNRTINIGQGASADTVQQLREELARDRASRYADTVRIVRDAKTKRVLS